MMAEPISDAVLKQLRKSARHLANDVTGLKHEHKEAEEKWREVDATLVLRTEELAEVVAFLKEHDPEFHLMANHYEIKD